MGLSASQARLLCITMRINDDQYKLMKLSAQTLELNAKSSNIDEEYDYRLNALNYSYNGNNQFTYSDLMGASGLTAGLESPVLMTNKDNKVVFDGTYGMAMQKAYQATAGRAISISHPGKTGKDKFTGREYVNPINDSACFNAFVSQITGDSRTDWYAAATTGKVGTSSAEKREILTSNAQAVREKFDKDRTEFINAYGTKPTQKYHEEEIVKFSGSYYELSEANKSSLDFTLAQYCKTQGETYGYENGNLKLRNDSKVAGLLRNQAATLEMKSADSVNALNNFAKMVADLFVANTEVSHYEDIPNEKGLVLSQWEKARKEFAVSKGYDSNQSFDAGAYPQAGNETTFVYESTASGTPNSGAISESSNGNVDTVETIKAAKFYLQIYQAAWKNGYVVDENISDRAYMNAQLGNNNLKIDGKFASENIKAEKMALGTVKDIDSEKEKIDAWYKKELKNVTNDQKKIELKQTSIQAELSALTTEQSSVQSLIDKNIERSFTYCQNG